jgi:competence protein ComFB
MLSFSELQNYNERLVFGYINDTLVNQHRDMGDDFFLDVACYALTHLPARYMRHEIDMAYYLADGEKADLLKQVKEAVLSAVKYIHTRRQNPSYRAGQKK